MLRLIVLLLLISPVGAPAKTSGNNHCEPEEITSFCRDFHVRRLMPITENTVFQITTAYEPNVAPDNELNLCYMYEPNGSFRGWALISCNQISGIKKVLMGIVPTR